MKFIMHDMTNIWEVLLYFSFSWSQHFLIVITKAASWYLCGLSIFWNNFITVIMLFVNVGEDAVMYLIIRVKIWEHSPIFSKSQTKKSYDYCMYCFVLILRLSLLLGLNETAQLIVRIVYLKTLVLKIKTIHWMLHFTSTHCVTFIII